MHWITVQAIFGVSKYCPKTILIDEKLIKVRIYLKTVWHFTMIVAFCIELRYLYLMNMEICVRIIGDVVIISVNPWCNICTIICYVTFDTFESSGFRVHHWYDFQSLSNFKKWSYFVNDQIFLSKLGLRRSKFEKHENLPKRHHLRFLCLLVFEEYFTVLNTNCCHIQL